MGPHDNVSGKSAVLNNLSVIRVRKRPARNFPGALALCPDRRDQMREHQMLRASPLCRSADIRCGALPIVERRRHPAALGMSGKSTGPHDSGPLTRIGTCIKGV